MKKMNKTIAAVSILAMASLPIAVFAQTGPANTPQPVSAQVQPQPKIVPATLGLITEFQNDQSGKFITVTGRGLAVTDQSEIILSITKEAKIIDAKGKTVPLQKVMDEKLVVKVFYSPNITKSLPARGTLLTLVVQDYTFTAVDGTVSSLSNAGILVKGTNIYSGADEEIILRVGDPTKLVDENGNTITQDELQIGMTLRGFYGPAVMESLPVQGVASYIRVNTQIADESEAEQDAPGTNGIITSYSDNKMTVIGQPLEQGGTNYIILNVDEATQIVDEEGNALNQEVLKEGAYVEAIYPQVMIMIYPAQSHADKIIVKKGEAPKIEGTIESSNDSGEGKIYVNVGSDSLKENDIILNLSDDTVIIPVIGGDTDLKPGMKITAFHPTMMTGWLPGLTKAEIIIVHEDPSVSNAE